MLSTFNPFCIPKEILLGNGISFVALFDALPTLPLVAFGANLSWRKTLEILPHRFYLLLFFVLINQVDQYTTYNCTLSIAVPRVSLLYPL